eukprot:1161352-Pelagomonas_calceolata.AAC.12
MSLLLSAAHIYLMLMARSFYWTRPPAHWMQTQRSLIGGRLPIMEAGAFPPTVSTPICLLKCTTHLKQSYLLDAWAKACLHYAFLG